MFSEITPENIVTQAGVIVDTLNADGPDLSYLSVLVTDPDQTSIQLVVGANFMHNCAAHFNKSSLGELIKILTVIQENMQYKGN